MSGGVCIAYTNDFVRQQIVENENIAARMY